MKRCLYRRAGIHMDQQAKRGAERRKKELTWAVCGRFSRRRGKKKSFNFAVWTSLVYLI
jgi:hypothetical protein